MGWEGTFYMFLKNLQIRALKIFEMLSMEMHSSAPSSATKKLNFVIWFGFDLSVVNQPASVTTPLIYLWKDK